MFKSKRGNKDGVWKTAVHSLTAAMVILALAASLLSTLSPRAEAADCPLGQVLNISGECVPEDLNLVAENDADPGRVDLNLTDVLEDETPTPQLDPDIVTEEETPTPEVDPVVVDIDITPAADPALPDIPTVEPLPEEPGEGYVTLQKYVCGSDPDPYQKTLAELQQDCAPPAQGFMFGLTKDAGDPAIVQVTDGNGSAFWTIPSPTTLTLNEAIPAGFGDPIVFCGSDPGSLSSYDVTSGVLCRSH